MKAFGTRLQDWRLAHGMTQTEAADWLDVPLRTYQQWEQGRQEPSQTGPVLKLLASHPPKSVSKRV